MTRLLTWLTLLGTGATVGVLAGYLVLTARALVSADEHLQQVLGDLEATRGNVQPLGDDLTTINGAAGTLRERLHLIDGHLAEIARLARG